jgi:hypothetical protein
MLHSTTNESGSLSQRQNYSNPKQQQTNEQANKRTNKHTNKTNKHTNKEQTNKQLWDH